MKHAPPHPRTGRAWTAIVVAAALLAGGGALHRRRAGRAAIDFTPPPIASTPAPPAGRRPVTFRRDVVPILRAHCVECHRPGDVGPFALLTYDDVKKHGRLVARVTEDRLMPPWKPEAGFGHFAGERGLSGEQIAAVRRWVEAGMVEGDDERAGGPEAPPPAEVSAGWRLGEPDWVLAMPAPFEVPAGGADVYQCFLLAGDVPRGRHVRAVEFRPGNRRVAHHAGLFYDTAGKARALAAREPGRGFRGNLFGPGFSPFGSLGGWAPGLTPLPLPPGTSRRLPRGCDMVLQVHYHPSGKPESDQSRVGLYFTDDAPTRALANVALGSARLLIPPGTKNYAVTDELTLPADVELTGVAPHAHAVCREMKAAATLPDGSVVPLLWIRDWDPSWQEEYRYREPVRLPRGTRVVMEFVYDNSGENLRNPFSPPRWVRFGQGTTDEMATLLLRVIPSRKKDAAGLKKLWDARFVRELSGEFETPGEGD